MAERRMFAKTIVLSDEFLDMPLSARCLYFTLGMFADDDGFVNSPKGIMRQCGASQDDLRILLAKKFILEFENGVIVIKHWRINNYLRNDRYSSTKYIEEKSQLIVNKNGSYSFGIPNNGIPNNGIHSIDKDSIGKNSIDKNNINVSKDTLCCTQNEIQRVVDAWNSLNLSKITKVVPDTNRYAWLKKRIKEYGVDGVLQAIENARTSDFLMGKTKEAFNFTFDWLVRPNNFPKVLDGNYNKSQSKANNVSSTTDGIGEWLNGKK